MSELNYQPVRNTENRSAKQLLDDLGNGIDDLHNDDWPVEVTADLNEVWFS